MGLNKHEMKLFEWCMKIDDAHMLGLFYAGENLRKLPSCLERPEYKDHIDWLQKTTRCKLFSLTNQFGINWFATYKFPIRTKYRHSIIIYGLWNDRLIAYFRKETTCDASGQSYIYFEKGQRIRANVLNDLFLNPHVKYIHSFSYAHWMNLIKRLHKISNGGKFNNHVYFEFGRYLLLNS